MLPSSYQTALRNHLSEQQYLTLELLILLIQAHRRVQLSMLASVFPQPIKYESRIRNLQRFLLLPQLCVKVLWFPLIKYWLRQAHTGHRLNRCQRRYLQKKHQHYGYWLIAMDRTEWKGRNLLMVTVVWGTHALPLYWQLLPQVGSSSLSPQKRLLQIALKLLKPYPVLVLGDREFHSPKLADWLKRQGVAFALRQKQNLHFQQSPDADYQVLKAQGFQPGASKFYVGVNCNKGDELGPFNLAVYWKRKYRQKGPKDPWYILTP